MAPSAVLSYFKTVNNGPNVQFNKCAKQLKYNATSLIKHRNKTHKIHLTVANYNRTRKTSEKDSILN